ncbi:LOB domain-containing protein 16 [Apostasia shenzhenica]|uniref:LOB domain-containing protein 16 n=1 Tax=Apostasia shenzhenica TaxID=1088818 RepID=A0A2I0ATC4_9ASPA|nr:LOB domain-containing protein 16 [Apostasia shenzhenica]
MAGAGSPCGACKFLRRRCPPNCIFAPYFGSENDAARFAVIHKVFGASNTSKLLSAIPAGDRCEAAVTISYEAQARLQDPVYGCVAHIFALQRQVASLQAQLVQARTQLAHLDRRQQWLGFAPNYHFMEEDGSQRQQAMIIESDADHPHDDPSTIISWSSQVLK